MADRTQLDRREFLTAATLASAGAMMFGAPGAAGATDRYPAIRKAAEAGRDAAIKRLQDWIALPSIAAEDRNMKEGAQYMANLARDAGFQSATIVPTDGHPGVFATMDNGAKRTLALYFMYDVKQFDPAEWSSPPLEARIVPRPGLGQVLIGRGAVNQKGPEATFLAALHAAKSRKGIELDFSGIVGIQREPRCERGHGGIAHIEKPGLIPFDRAPRTSQPD